MDKATVVDRKIVCNENSYPMENIAGIALFKQGVSITFYDGTSILADIDPGDFFTITDRCPWAVRCSV